MNNFNKKICRIFEILTAATLSGKLKSFYSIHVKFIFENSPFENLIISLTLLLHISN